MLGCLGLSVQRTYYLHWLEMKVAGNAVQTLFSVVDSTHKEMVMS